MLEWARASTLGQMQSRQTTTALGGGWWPSIASTTADPAATGRIFTLYNELKQHGGRMLAASRAPLATLPLREDLRTRLGWGLVYEVLALADDEKAAALVALRGPARLSPFGRGHRLSVAAWAPRHAHAARNAGRIGSAIARRQAPGHRAAAEALAPAPSDRPCHRAPAQDL